MTGSAVLDDPRLGDQPEAAPLDADLAVPDTAGSDRSPFRWRRFIPRGRPTPEQLVTAAVVLLACGFTFNQLQPPLPFTRTPPARAGMGAHPVQPDYPRNHLLH